MTAIKRQVELLEKNHPRQARAKRTYKSILTAAAELLVEVGVERISTNLIAQRAGITVPALYRYFPNKYAVLNALGAILLDRQAAVFRQWIETHCTPDEPERLLLHIHDVLRKTYEVTLEQTGGLEISQALRALAPLQELRLSARRLLAERLAIHLARMPQAGANEEALMQIRLTVDLTYSMVEMALEDPALAPEHVLRKGADMLKTAWGNGISLSASQAG